MNQTTTTYTTRQLFYAERLALHDAGKYPLPKPFGRIDYRGRALWTLRAEGCPIHPDALERLVSDMLHGHKFTPTDGNAEYPIATIDIPRDVVPSIYHTHDCTGEPTHPGPCYVIGYNGHRFVTGHDPRAHRDHHRQTLGV